MAPPDIFEMSTSRSSGGRSYHVSYRGIYLAPSERFELPTYGLEDRYSTPVELRGLVGMVAARGVEPRQDAYETSAAPGNTALVEPRGIEPLSIITLDMTLVTALHDCLN